MDDPDQPGCGCLLLYLVLVWAGIGVIGVMAVRLLGW